MARAAQMPTHWKEEDAMVEKLSSQAGRGFRQREHGCGGVGHSKRHGIYVPCVSWAIWDYNAHVSIIYKP